MYLETKDKILRFSSRYLKAIKAVYFTQISFLSVNYNQN
jgi:hypothetical protein